MIKIQIGNSPYHPQILPGPISVLSKMYGTLGGIAGDTEEFGIIALDEFANLNTSCDPVFSATLTEMNGETINCTQDDCSNGNYTMFYRLFQSGYYFLIIYVNQIQPLIGCPYNVIINPGPISPEKTTAEGPGISNSIVNITTVFQIIPQDQFGNNITNCSYPPSSNWLIQLTQQTSSTFGNITSCFFGVYDAQYIVSSPGTWSLFVEYNNLNIQNSPFTVEATALYIKRNSFLNPPVIHMIG